MIHWYFAALWTALGFIAGCFSEHNWCRRNQKREAEEQIRRVFEEEEIRQARVHYDTTYRHEESRWPF